MIEHACHWNALTALFLPLLRTQTRSGPYLLLAAHIVYTANGAYWMFRRGATSCNSAMLTTLRQGVVITQVWTCLMVFVLLSAGGTGDSDLKDTLAFVWLAGALACAFGILPCRLYLAKRKWIQKVGDERGASFFDSVAKLCKGECTLLPSLLLRCVRV